MPHLPAIIGDDDLTGLEDFDTKTDLIMPVLRIDGAEAVYVDNLSGERSPKLEVVMLGMVKQRVLWPPEMAEEVRPPLCRSYDFVTGHPGEDFPAAASGLTIVPDELVSCAACQLKEWGSHPKGETPWCTEQWVFIVLTQAGDVWAPAQFTVQRSGMKDAKAYLSSYARSKTPLFTNTTVLTLDARKRGTVKYAVPKFAKGQPTPEEFHAEWRAELRRLRDWLQTPRTPEEPEQQAVTSGSRGAAAVGDNDEVGF